MRSSPLFVFFFSFVFAISSLAATSLPRQLSAKDRVRALQILGCGSAAKILDNPYPLGGYAGFEVGLASEFIPMDELSHLGSGTSESGELNYYTLTFGKGLYHNIDTMIYFSPFTGAEEVANFGGQVRWGFYEARFFPLSFSTVISSGGSSFSNLVNVTTLGVDLVATVNVDNVALFLGAGGLRVVGQFIGGSGGVTDDGVTAQESISQEHYVFGVSVKFSKMFVAMEVDRYVDSIYSGKLGLRF